MDAQHPVTRPNEERNDYTTYKHFFRAPYAQHPVTRPSETQKL